MKESLKQAKNQFGFSLIEILIALALMSMGLGFVGSKLFEQFTEGKKDAAEIQMKSFAGALQDYRRSCNHYPSTEEGLQALISKEASDCKHYRAGGYLDAEEIPLDPWDNEYVYESNGNSFNIYSMGEDGEDGTEDDIRPFEKNRE